jgi:hypothetical protein
MDRVSAINASLPSWQARVLASLDAGSAGHSPWASSTKPDPIAALDPTKPDDKATDEQLTLHFISHINAECFISLLQTMDPMPYDSRARTEYKRFYRQLRETLEVPLPPADS